MAASKEHNELALMGLTWLGNKVTLKGMKAQTEVALAEKYIVDALALCSFQGRFFERYCQHSKLKPITGHAVYNAETGKRDYEWNGDVNNYFACVFEAKATRSDFLSTFGNNPADHQNRHEPIGSLHWCITPKKLIDPDELPEFWGLLETYGSGLREVKKPLINILTEARLNKIAHQILWSVQKRRNYILCAECQRYTEDAVCRRCFIKKGR